MTIRTACITAGVAALALPAFAGHPKVQQVGQAVPQKHEPLRAAKYTIIDGRMVLTTPWMSPDQATQRGPTWNWRFDAIEINPADPNGASDFTDACGLGGGRWLLYTTDQATFDYCNPFITNDMSNMAAGAVDGLFMLYYQRAALPGSPPNAAGEQLFIACQWFETTFIADGADPNACTDGDPVDFVDGVIFDFGVTPNGFWYSAIDLSAFAIQMTPPADGSGSYQYIYGNAFDEPTGTITLSTCIQPGLWGTAAPRVGTQLDIQYDDDNPTDGIHDLAECYTYAYGVCPDPLGAAIGLSGMDSGNPCACPGDVNGDGIRDISDLGLFLAAFGLPATNCADINGDGVVDISDLGLFLAGFGVPCP